MDRYEKILTIENEVEAQLLQKLLDERKIPYVMKSYYDSALNGLYQAQKGWGHIEAPDEYHEEIVKIYTDISS
ncbi:hypothetical protein AMJ74_00575 [candidate division WOR_3 bacterium SM1_77]|uniref:Uncharacterized protein n=1 Tax=candidate division WOR_3 bacterium SM1_77 TaxID=1703778 RepID=A0A0S8K279_UNCW3|nr:MAG: hypothetical protein AMJ74_00575 [candidate division WOR_3 bacterium SM1_77]